MTIRHTELVEMSAKAPFVKTVIADIDCDTIEDIPEVDGLNGYILHQGSVVDVITVGKLAKLGGDGKWYSPTGELIKG